MCISKTGILKLLVGRDAFRRLVRKLAGLLIGPSVFSAADLDPCPRILELRVSQLN